MRKRLFSFLCAVLCCVLIVNSSAMPVGAWFGDEESFNGYLTFENIVEDETYPTGSYVYHCRVLYEDKTIFAHVDDIAVLTNSTVSKPTEISTLVQFDRNGYFVTVDLADGSTNLSTAYFPILNDLSLEHKETEDGDIYLPLEKMLYLMNATWSVSEDRVYICAPKDTLWSVASEYYRAAQNRPDKWMFLGTESFEALGNTFKYGLSSIMDEIDYRIFISALDAYDDLIYTPDEILTAVLKAMDESENQDNETLKQGIRFMLDEMENSKKLFVKPVDDQLLKPYSLYTEDVERILTTFSTDETAVLQGISEESVNEFISKWINGTTAVYKEFTDILGLPDTLDDIANSTDLPSGELIEEFSSWDQFFNKLDEIFRKNETFTLWDTVDTEFLSKMMDTAGIGLDALANLADTIATYGRAYQWTETYVEQMRSFSQMDISRYNGQTKRNAEYAQNAADMVYTARYDLWPQLTRDIMDIVFDQLFEATKVGKIIKVYNMAVTAISFIPSVKAAMEVGDTVQDLSTCIDIGNMAGYHFADVLNSVIQKDIKTSDIHKAQNGDYSITPLDEIRYAYDLMLSSYLRSWDMLYQLSQTEEIYYDRGLVEIKNQALEIYTLIIRLNESARYDGALFIQKDFGNLYSEEVKEEETTEGSPSGLPENDVVREKIPSSLIIVRGPALTASQLTWLVEPTWDYQTVEPIPGPPVSDILGTPNYADGTTPFFQQDKTFPFVEMSFPLYSSLPEYYGVIEPDGDSHYFYLPDRVDTSSLGLQNVATNKIPQRFDNMGLYLSYHQRAELGVLSPPWDIFRSGERGLGSGHFVWDSDSRQFCFFGGGEGTSCFKKANLLGLHKPYPVTEVRLGNLVQELGDEYVGSSLDVNWDWEQINREDGFYAYAASDGTLLTDFVYRGVGDFSDGLSACSLDGKNWGYIDETGTPVTDFIYEPVWLTNQDSESYTSYWEKPQAYPCTDDTIVVRKDGEYGLLYRDGTTLIEFGELEAMAPSWNHQLWAKQDGLWGLIDLADAKEKAGIPVPEEKIPDDDEILSSNASNPENTSGENSSDIHYIYTAEDLFALRDACLNQEGDGNYILMNDIDLSEYSSPWQPIGSANARSFSGNFDGGGYTISGFNVSQFDDENTNSEGKTWGLFGFIYGATIENLNLVTDINISSYQATNNVRLGAIAGMGWGTIKNCTVNGSISVNADISSGKAFKMLSFDVGGIAGCEWGGWDLEVIDCKNNANIAVTSSSGFGTNISVCGIIGNGVAKHCYNAGNITCQFPNGPTYVMFGITYRGATDSCNAADFMEFTGYGGLGSMIGRIGANQTNCVANKDMMVCGKTVSDGIHDGVGMPKTQLEDWYAN